MLVVHSCLTLLRPHGLYPPGSFVHWISQARIPEWLAISFSMALPNLGTEPISPALQADSLPLSHQGNQRRQQQQNNSNHGDFFFQFLERSQNFLACSFCIVCCPECFKMMSCHSWFLSSSSLTFLKFAFQRDIPHFYRRPDRIFASQKHRERMLVVQEELLFPKARISIIPTSLCNE